MPDTQWVENHTAAMQLPMEVAAKIISAKLNKDILYKNGTKAFGVNCATKANRIYKCRFKKI